MNQKRFDVFYYNMSKGQKQHSSTHRHISIYAEAQIFFELPFSQPIRGLLAEKSEYVGSLHGVVVYVLDSNVVVSSNSSNAITFTFGLIPLGKSRNNLTVSVT